MSSRLRATLWLVLLLSAAFDAAYLGTAFAHRHSPIAPRSGLFADPDPDGPRLVLARNSFDFGTVEQGQKASHRFSFRNAGREELVIGRLRTSCGCTASVVSQETVPPGGRGELLVEFDAGQRSGPFANTVEIESNDPFARNLVTITGRVQPLCWLEPEVVDFGRVQPGREARREVRVRRLRPDLPLDVERVISTNPAVGWENLLRTEEGYRFEAVARPGPQDALQGAIQVWLQNSPVLCIYVRTTGVVEPLEEGVVP